MKRAFLSVTLFVLAIGLSGCVRDQPKDLSGQTFAPISREQVKLYNKRPVENRYDIIGMIRVPLTPDIKWDKQGDANKAFDRLIDKAAAMGANGVLFEVPDTEFDVLAGAGYHHEFYQVPIRLKPERTMVARAILLRPNN